MKVVAYLLAAVLGAIGFMFLAGSQDQVFRLVIGVVLLFAAAAVVYLTRVRPQHIETTTVQRIDLSGDVNIEEIRCRSCNAPLGKDEISVRAGAIFVECSHCGATYQFEEAPKW